MEILTDFTDETLQQIRKVIGIPDSAQDWTLRVGVNELPQITCQMLIETNGKMSIENQKFRLIPIDQKE